MPNSRFAFLGVHRLKRKIDQALLMNNVHRVPYYGELWRKSGQDLLFFDPGGIDWEQGKINGLMLKGGRWRKGYVDFPKTVYNRCFPEPRQVIERLSEVVGEENIFNTLTHFDKWEVFQALQGSEVQDYLPPTFVYDQEKLADLLTEYGSIILKPRLGHGGYGVTRVTLLAPDFVLIHSTGFPLPVKGEEFYLPFLLTIAPPEKFIAQVYIDSAFADGGKADVRILMQKNGVGKWEAGGELSRLTSAASLLTNAYNAILSPDEVASREQLEVLYGVSELVAVTLDGKLANLGELGVDFLIDRSGRPWILEVNGKPDKSLFRKLGDEEMLKRVYLNPLKYQQYLLGN